MERVSRICGVLGKAMGLARGDLETLRLASTLHDVGKMVTPDSILFKPGPLTAAEFAVAKEHTQVGHDLLSGKEGGGMLEAAATIALTHHERHDGNGYPNGLAREAIPLMGRITAVADVFDTVSSDRPYKTGVKPEEALDLVRKGGGTQFDPDVVAALESRFDEVLAIKSEIPDNGGRAALAEIG